MLSNAYFLAKFRFDTAENEPAKKLQNFRKMHFRKMHELRTSQADLGGGGGAPRERWQFGNFCKFLAGSFSAVSKRNFARKYAFDSIFQALQDLHPFAPLQSQIFRKKSV